jgi:hypothetical protein
MADKPSQEKLVLEDLPCCGWWHRRLSRWMLAVAAGRLALVIVPLVGAVDNERAIAKPTPRQDYKRGSSEILYIFWKFLSKLTIKPNNNPPAQQREP